MNLRRTILLTLPLLLSSSVALAQEASSASSTDATKSENKTERKDQKKADTAKKSKDAKKPGEGSTTIAGQKIENKDSDLDMAVSKTKTTSAEQPPHRDVVESRAEEVRNVEGKRWSAAPLLGYGTADLKFGVGARAGYTFETPVYVGGTFLYHFGNSTNAANPNGVTDTDRRFYYPAVEAGYDIGIGPLLVRPYGGVGVLFVRTELTSNGNSNSATDKQLMIYPGATAQYIFPRSPIYVGADMRVLLPLEGESAALSLFGTAGVTM
jgi:hypothetical protein